jgi:hypothetical protein
MVLPKTVVDETILVAREFDDICLRIEADVNDGLIQSPSLDASDLAVVRSRCPRFPGRLDPGELECLACLLADTSANSLVCSSDAVVFRYLGWLGMDERGISLEEVLRSIGHAASLSQKLCKDFRVRWTQKGFAEALQHGFRSR